MHKQTLVSVEHVVGIALLIGGATALALVALVVLLLLVTR